MSDRAVCMPAKQKARVRIAGQEKGRGEFAELGD